MRMTSPAVCQCKQKGEGNWTVTTIRKEEPTGTKQQLATTMKQINSDQNRGSPLSPNSTFPSFPGQFNNCNFPTTMSAAQVPSLLTTRTNPVLHDIHMVMIGDSLMRYQYLSLVYRLRHGVWFDTSKWYFNLVSETTFADPFHRHTWGAFLFHTNRILHPNEVCDCHRRPVYKMEEIVENRYYYDPILNNSIVFLLAYGHEFPVVGRLHPKKVRKIRSGSRSGWQGRALQKYGRLSWKYNDRHDVIRNHVQRLIPQPRHIVLNAGAWKHSFGYDRSASNHHRNLSQATFDLVRTMQDTPQYQYVWRTTTYRNNRTNDGLESDPIMCELVSICVNVSYTHHVRQDLYWDKIHFLEPVYRVQNEQMLDLLGYLPSDYERMNTSDILE